MKEYTVTFTWETEMVDARNPKEARLDAYNRLMDDLRHYGDELMRDMKVKYTGKSTWVNAEVLEKLGAL